MAIPNKTKNAGTVERLRRMGYPFKLSYAYGKPRLVTEDERQDVSPRLTEPEMRLWLDGFIASAVDWRRPYSMPDDLKGVYASFFGLLINRLETIREHLNDGKLTEARATIGDTIRTLADQRKSYLKNEKDEGSPE